MHSRGDKGRTLQKGTSNHGQHNGRLMLGVGGILFIPLAGAGAWSLFFVLPRPQGPLDWGVRIFLEELAISATFFFSLGFLWAISGNRWLKKMLDTASVRFAWFLIPLAIPAFVVATYVLIFG
jgi:hypothetical protein